MRSHGVESMERMKRVEDWSMPRPSRAMLVAGGLAAAMVPCAAHAVRPCGVLWSPRDRPARVVVVGDAVAAP